MTNEREHMTGLSCLNCKAPSTNGTVLCKRCVITVQVALANLVNYHADLFSLGSGAVRVRRSSGVSDPTGTAAGRNETRPVDAPDTAAAETRNMLATWSRVLVDDRPQLTEPSGTVRKMAAFLSHNVRSIATLDWAGEMTRDVLQFEQRLRRIIERSKGRWYAGICSNELAASRPHDEHTCMCACHRGEPCDMDCAPEAKTVPAAYCERDLYVQPGASYVKCPSCGAQWQVAQRRSALFEEARDTLLPVHIIASAVVSLIEGEPSVRRLTERLNKWVQRGTIDDYGVRVVMGRPVRVYRMGDVLDTLTRNASRTQR